MQINDDTGFYSELQVLQSGAGFYIGRLYTNTSGEMKGLVEPGFRESGYFPTKETAQDALDSGNYEYRDAPENRLLYRDQN